MSPAPGDPVELTISDHLEMTINDLCAADHSLGRAIADADTLAARGSRSAARLGRRLGIIREKLEGAAEATNALLEDAPEIERGRAVP